MDQNDDCHKLALNERTLLSGRVNQYATEDSKTIQDKRDACHLEEISKIKECKKSSPESNDLLRGFHVGCGRPSSDAINTQSIVLPPMNYVQGGSKLLNCDINISLRQRNDNIAEKCEDDNSITFKKKRLKKTELSDLTTGNSENEEAESSLPDLHNRTSTSFDQPVELKSASPCFSGGSMSGKGLTAGNDYSKEVVEMMESSDCCAGIEKTSSNDDNKLQTDKSNQNTNENGRDSDVVTIALVEGNPHRATNDVVLTVVSSQTDASKYAGEASSATCSGDLFLHVDDNEKSHCVAQDASTIKQDFHDSDKLATSFLVELNDEAKKIATNVEVHNMESKEKNVDRYPGIPPGEAFDRNNPLPMSGAEKSLQSSANPSVTQLGDPKGVAFQIVSGDVSVAVEKSFAGYRDKKLLVLDVNGLLADISSYVPYDYDPDEILLKKAIFKRPYCDDFLKFCFERFNVGVWSSRTKTKLEPILDFLLGNDKHKLLFSWDQSHCTYTCFNTVEKRHKPLLLKKLKKLWEKCESDLPWERGAYNETNTLLIDDSPYKAVCNPPHTAIFPYTYHFRNVGDNSLGPGGDLRVYLAGLAMAENVQEYVKQNPFGQRPITEKNLSWGFYSKVIEAWSSPPRETAEDSST